MDPAEHEQAVVPEVFFKAREVFTIALGVDMPKCGDVLFLAKGVFGGRGKKKIVVDLF